MQAVRKIGIDPGFGGVKAAEVNSTGVITHVIPSVVGLGTTDAGGLTLGGVVRSRKKQEPHIVAFDGIEYLVGPGVARHARPIERMDFDRFTDSPELRALIYAALFRLVDGGNYRLALAIGLPVEVLQDKASAAATERGISQWLLGEHEFAVDGQPAGLEIISLRAKIAQPLATWFDWGLNNDGQWYRGPAAVKAPAMIIDLGFNTLDISVIEDREISTRYTSGDTLGMRRAAEMVANSLLRHYGIEMSLHEADALVQNAIGTTRILVYVEGQPVDVWAEVKQAINTLGTEVVRFVESKAGRAKKFKVFITGGGALVLGIRLLSQYPHATIVDQPVLANARGLAKLANRKGFLGV